MVICLKRGAWLFVYGSADATASQKTPSSHASFKFRLVLSVWWLTQVVLEKSC